MFKNLILFRIQPGWSTSPEQLAAALDAGRFLPCGATQPQSLGWVAPRGGHGALLEVIGGQWLLQLQVEQRLLPGAVVKRRADELAQAIEQSTGRKPGRKEGKALREQAMLELLPRAFTRQSALRVWIDPEARLLALDTGSSTRAEEVVTLLVKALDGLALNLINTAESPAAVMSAWLVDGEPPAAFTVDRECELKSADEQKSAVRYARHPLDIEEVRQHIQQGKRPTRLALTWNGRVSFVLTDTLQLKRIEFLDLVFEGQDNGDSQDADARFDTDAAIATGEFSALIPALIEALGGEQAFGQIGTDSATNSAAAPTALPTSAGTTAPGPADDLPPW
ncbi:MAG: exonuclease [Pseudomonadota bacterium]